MYAKRMNSPAAHELHIAGRLFGFEVSIIRRLLAVLESFQRTNLFDDLG